jgi:DNA polymerase-1
MLYVAADTETARFGPGRQAPALACISAKYERGRALIHWHDAQQFLDEVLLEPGYTIVGHNIAYDMAVIAANHPKYLPAIFKMYDEGRVRDTMIREKLLDIALGRFRGYHTEPTYEERKKGLTKGYWVTLLYDLDNVYYRYTKKRLDKSTWRLRYGELRKFPLAQWPAGAIEYPLKDVDATWDVFYGQSEAGSWVNREVRKNFTRIDEPDVFADEAAQCRAGFWIQLMRVWGIRTRRDRVMKLRRESLALYEKTVKFLQSTEVCPDCSALLSNSTCDVHGVFPKQVSEEKEDKRGRKQTKLVTIEADTLVRANGVRNTAAAKARMVMVMGGESNCRRTKKGGIQLDEDACTASGDPLLQEYSTLSKIQSVVKKDIPALLKGLTMPIHANFNSLIATGRTSCSKPNIQNIRRLPGIRECFIPRKGNVFLDADYDGLELRTLAQVCLKIVGWSKLAETLNSGWDPHLMVAAEILNITYEEATAREKDEDVFNARQTAKVANFGFPGGLGIEALILFAKKTYGVALTPESAKKLKRQWFAAFPEMEYYFQHINNLCSEDPVENMALVEHLFVKRLRGGIRYTVACNSYFQGLGSDATKNAGWLIAKACYIDKDSPLFGCRIVNYIHDQFLVEAPEERAHEACMELARLMVEGAKPYLPDVVPTVKKPLVARCWSKNAKPVKDKNGRLIPWQDDFDAAA